MCSRNVCSAIAQDELFRNFNRVLNSVKHGSTNNWAMALPSVPASNAKLAKVAGAFTDANFDHILQAHSVRQPKLKHCGNLRKKNSIMKMRCPRPFF
jgi:hypothetical protein